MIGRVALLVTFKKAKPKSQSLSRSHIRDLATIVMKPQSLLILLFIGLFPVCGHAQVSAVEIQIIKDSLKAELGDTARSKWSASQITQMLTLLDYPGSLFPYSEFDAAQYVNYLVNPDADPFEWQEHYKEYAIEGKWFSHDEIAEILEIVNNPLNFEWSECGTPFINGAIVFYKAGIEVARITHACDGTQIDCTPRNPLNRSGIINDMARKRLFMLIK
jgi:hypothetical protein